MGEIKPSAAWFGGDAAGLELLDLFAELLHTWDDLVDRDQPVSAEQVNRAFGICLVWIPNNPVYRTVQRDVLPMWVTVISAYEAANHYERTKDAHGLEIGHTLRYAAGQIIAYAMQSKLTADAAREFVPQMWKYVAAERFDPYRKEHEGEK